MVKIRANLKGAGSLVTKLRKAKIPTSDIAAVAVNAMLLVRDAARRHVPVDVGTLMENIVVMDKSTGKTVKVYCGIFAGSTVNYAVYVEYGTGIYAENGQGRKTAWQFQVQSAKWAQIFGVEVGDWSPPFIGAHPQPFMRPAWDEESQNVLKVLTEGLQDRLWREIS